MNDTEYKLVMKAYMVGEKPAISLFRAQRRLGYTDHVELIYAKTRGRAKAEYADRYLCDFTGIRCIRVPEEDHYYFEGKHLTLAEITIKVEHRKNFDILRAMAEETPDIDVYIYSGQWGAYWKPDACGYTEKRDMAGVYPAWEAWNMVSHCGPEKKITFIPVWKIELESLSLS